LPSPANDPVIAAVSERVRAVIARQPGHDVGTVAQTFRVDPDQLRRLIDERDGFVDAEFLIDVVTALVHEAGVDPKWLLIGQYEPATHRHALWLGEDRTSLGARRLRNFVEEQYQRVRDSAFVVSARPNLEQGE